MLWFRRFGRELCVSWSVVCVIMWVVCVGVSVGWVLLAVQVWKCAGGERCVDLETQKRARNQLQKVGKPK